MEEIINSDSEFRDISHQELNDTANSTEPCVKTESSIPRVIYVYNDDYIRCCDNSFKVPNRASMTHSLLKAYGLLKHMRLINPRFAKREELTLFHSHEYVDCLERLSAIDDEEKYDEEAELFGLSYDCPAFPGVFEYASFITGASVKAAQCLMTGIADVAINWPGGWHHAKRDEAAGFCYLNDIVVAILTLRQKFDRVLYVDLDLHHGDGVEDAFCATSKVLTVSFHKTSPGFFPGGGFVKDVGLSKGKYYTVNVPLRDGIKDEKYCTVFERVMNIVKLRYKPAVIVCQCGADGLEGDPMASYNLTHLSLGKCVRTLHSWKLPLLLVGGGGYNLANTARCWAYITSIVTGQTIPTEIPEHKHFVEYGPDYELAIRPGNRSDSNDKAYLDQLLEDVEKNLQHLI